MKMNEIRTEVVEKLQVMLQDESVSLEEVDIVKFNDIYQYGIVFKSGDIGKTLYVNDFASDRKSADRIADEMLAAYENSVDAPPWELVRDIQTKQSLSSLKDHLFVTLLDVSRNTSYLQTIPYKKVSDGYAYIAQIRHMAPDGYGFMAAAVTQTLIDSNEWDIDQVFAIAINNTLKNAAPVLFNMGNALMGVSNNLLDKEGYGSEDMLVLTNADQIFGAASLFLPGVIDKIHTCIETGFYAIPSSVHEVIIVPETLGFDIESLSTMCKEANKTVVEQKDILSDHVLYFPMK